MGTALAWWNIYCQMMNEFFPVFIFPTSTSLHLLVFGVTAGQQCEYCTCLLVATHTGWTITSYLSNVLWVYPCLCVCVHMCGSPCICYILSTYIFILLAKWAHFYKDVLSVNGCVVVSQISVMLFYFPLKQWKLYSWRGLTSMVTPSFPHGEWCFLSIMEGLSDRD